MATTKPEKNFHNLKGHREVEELSRFLNPELESQAQLA